MIGDHECYQRLTVPQIRHNLVKEKRLVVVALALIFFVSFSFSYGDRSPRGFVARMFAIAWVLVGLVITSIVTGVVTTSLTAITLSTDVKLYGTKVGSSLARNVIMGPVVQRRIRDSTG